MLAKMWLMGVPVSSTRLRLLLILAVSLIASHDGVAHESGSPAPAGQSQAKAAATTREVTPNLPVTEQLSRDTSHTYRIDLLPGQYVSILVMKGDVSLQLTVAELGGQTLHEFVSRRYGPLRASFISSVQGTHFLEVSSLENDASSHEYVLRVEEVRAATEQDRRTEAAVKSYAEAEKLRAEWKEESLRAAIKRYDEASACYQANARPREAAVALLDAGDTFFALSEYSNALDFYHRALKLSRRAGDERGIMQALNSAGYVHANTDNNEQALVYFQQVLNFYRRARPATRSVEDIRSMAQVNNNLGEVYYYRGDFIKAKKYYNLALEMHVQVGDRRGQALAHLNLGYTYSDSGDLHSSLAHLALALTLARAVNDKRGEALSHTARGIVLAFRGEKQSAFNAYKQAMQLFHTIGDRQGEAASLNSMGKAYEDLNEPQVALDHYTLALKLFQEGGNADAEAVTRYYIGRAYRLLKNDTQALEHYKLCLSLSRALGKRRIENYALIDIASIHAARGQKQQALDGYGEVLRFYRKVKDKRGHEHVLNSIGDIYFSSADRRKALDFYRQALTLSRAAEDHKGEATTLYKVARAERDSGDLEQALTDIKAALSISESLRSKVARQDLRSSYFASVYEQYELYIDLLMRMHARHPSESFDAAALETSEAARARTLLEVLADANLDIRRGVSPELLERERSLEQSLVAQAESHALLRTGGKRGNEAGEMEEETRRLTTEYQEVQGEIREQGLRSAAFVQSSPLRLKDIQTNLLDDDTILLEYALGDEKSYLWVVTATSLSSYELPSRAEIESVAREVYRLLTAYQTEGQELTAGESGRADSLDVKYWQTASVMSQMLLGRVASQLGRKRLLIVADGALQYIPFEALPIPTTPLDDDRDGVESNVTPVPLVMEHEIISLPSASTLAALRRRETRTASTPSKLVVVLADPVFEPDDPRFQPPGSTTQIGQAERVEAVQLRASLRDIREAGSDLLLSRLPFTLQEGKAIMAVTPAGESKLVTGFAANRALAVEGGLSGYRIVHFATHGVINCRHPELSGIVLSTLNERGERENGFLQLHDIYKLDLSSDLVVLSACNTGLGEEIQGEGLVGLTQGFLHVGAKSVIASLWRVDDRATAALMQYFYRALFDDGLSPAAALREAKKTMWREKRWRSPYYWAAFVLQGEYRQRIKADAVSSSVTHTAFVILILLTILLVIGVLRGSAKRRKVSAS